MTQRSEWKQLKLETKAKLMAWVANRLFSLSFLLPRKKQGC